MKEKREMCIVAENVDLPTYERVLGLCKELYPRRRSFTYSRVDGDKYFLKYNLTLSEHAYLNFEYNRRYGMIRG